MIEDQPTGRAVVGVDLTARARRMLGWFVVSVVLLLARATPAVAQARPPAPGDVEWHFRHELFQMLLEERGLTVETSLEAALASPRESILVVLGNLDRKQVDSGKLIPFATGGGRVLLASDRAGRMGPAVSFVAGPITANNQSTQYQQLSDCLRVSNLVGSHPVMDGVHEIIVNRSGWLSLLPEQLMNWQVIATVPETCKPQRSRGEPLIAVSQISRPGAGSMIIAADPSLFTNSMMWHGDNAILAIRISEELCRGEKTKLVFIVDGQPLPSYRQSPLLDESTRPAPPVPQPPPQSRHQLPGPPPKPTWEQRLRVANAVIEHVEESNIHNEALIDNPRYPNQRLYPRVILLILAVLTGIWLLSKLRQSASVRPGEPAPREMKTAKRMSADTAGFGRNYASIAQSLARELCRELTGSPVPRDWHGQLSDPDSHPTLATLTSAQRSDLEAIVELATDRNIAHISASGLRRYGSMILRLRSVHRSSASIVGSDLRTSNTTSLLSAK